MFYNWYIFAIIFKLMKIFTHLLFAFYFLLIGTGFNYVNFCCSSCSEVGMHKLASHSCIPADKNTHNCCSSTPKNLDIEHQTCTLNTETAGKCELTRLKTDVPTNQILRQKLNLSTLSLSYYSPNTLLNQFFWGSNLSADYNPPNNTLSKGRSILLHKSVLII